MVIKIILIFFCLLKNRSIKFTIVTFLNICTNKFPAYKTRAKKLLLSWDREDLTRQCKHTLFMSNKWVENIYVGIIRAIALDIRGIFFLYD